LKFSDRLRPPGPKDEQPNAYKEWLHLNVFDARSDTAIVLNAALHGPVNDACAVASATALIGSGGDWSTHIETFDRVTATVTDEAIVVGDIALKLEPVSGGLSASFASDATQFTVFVSPLCDSIDTVGPAPFGSGWIGWRAVPALSVSGSLQRRDHAIDLDGAIAYHDHNWGRWRWGDDIGWEWLTWPSAKGAIVMSRSTDRAHRQGTPYVCVSLPGRRGWRNHSYGGSSTRVEFPSWRRGCESRVPGAMAALHSGRMAPMLPAAVEIMVNDGFDKLRATMRVEHVIQVIVAEPCGYGYSFIHELFGRFEVTGTCEGHQFEFDGQGVFEYVD
jgi:hypothetical protein